MADSQHPVYYWLQAAKQTSCFIMPPELGDFVQAYREQNAESIVSVHAYGPFDECYYQARLARTMLQGQRQIEVFEAPTISEGVRFLLEAAASFAANRQTTSTQVMALLQRLTIEMRTFLWTADLRSLNTADRATGALAWLKRIATGRQLYAIDPERRLLIPQHDWHRQDLSLPRNEPYVLSLFGYPNANEGRVLVKSLIALQQTPSVIEDLRVVSREMPKRFAVIILTPSPEKVRKIEDWVLKWNRD